MDGTAGAGFAAFSVSCTVALEPARSFTVVSPEFALPDRLVTVLCALGAAAHTHTHTHKHTHQGLKGRVDKE